MITELSLIFLLFLFLETGIEFWLAARQKAAIRTHQHTVPTAFIGTISQRDHQITAAYALTKTDFRQKRLIIGALILLLWTIGGLLNIIDQAWRSLEWSEFWTGVAVLVSFGLLSTLMDLPLKFYDTFRIEAQFGFNRISLRLFISDFLKWLLVGLIIGIPFVALALWLIEYTKEFWWLYVWVVWMSVNLLMRWAYPVFIAPLFNKFQPLKNEELKKGIEALLQRNGFSSQGIFVMNGSKRTGSANAYLTGFGKNKRIVFFDTLLDKFNTDEVIAVLAHEIGHFKRKHFQKRFVSFAVMIFAGLALLNWLMQQDGFYNALGVSTPSTYIALLLFVLVLPVFIFFLQPIIAWISRKYEFEADDFAAEQSNPLMLIQALVKLYRESASSLTQDPLYCACYETHPQAPVRVAYLSRKLSSS